MKRYSMVWDDPRLVPVSPRGWWRTLLWQLICWSTPEALRPLVLGEARGPHYTLSGLLRKERESK